MDRLPWTRFHWLVIIGLGVSASLDGLRDSDCLAIVGQSYLQADAAHHDGGCRHTRLRLSLWRGCGGTAVRAKHHQAIWGGRRCSWCVLLSTWWLAGLGAFRSICTPSSSVGFFAGMGIGGENTAINSAIDELIPSHDQGRVDIAVTVPPGRRDDRLLSISPCRIRSWFRSIWAGESGSSSPRLRVSPLSTCARRHSRESTMADDPWS